MNKNVLNLQPGIHQYLETVNNIKINFLCKYLPDSEEVILFIHGLACSSDSFRNVFDENYFPTKSLLLIDLPGFGQSGKSHDFSYSMEDQAALIEELLTHFPKWKIRIAAHSMGGAIALLFSSDFYSRILSFANIEGNLVSEDCGMLSRGVIALTYDEYVNNMYPKQVIEFKDHHQLRFEETNPFAIYYSAKSLVHWSDSNQLLEKYSNLNCRKSYFYGEENNNMPVLEKLHSANKFMIAKSGHGMMTENPKEFYSKLALFIIPDNTI